MYNLSNSTPVGPYVILIEKESDLQVLLEEIQHYMASDQKSLDISVNNIIPIPKTYNGILSGGVNIDYITTQETISNQTQNKTQGTMKTIDAIPLSLELSTIQYFVMYEVSAKE